MNTKGWDTICLVKTEHINHEVKNSWHSLNNNFAKREAEYEINGKFKPWQIVDGGSNKLVRFKIPFESGILKILGGNCCNVFTDENNQKEFDLSNCECIIELMMDFINTNDSKKLLTLNIKHFAKTREDITNSNSGWIVPVLFKGNIPKLYQFIILESVCHYLIDHPNQINYVFASINFAQNINSWVIPVKCRYSYLDSQPSYMSILSVCHDQEIGNMPVDIDVNPFSSNSNSYFIISSKLFLLNVMVPSLLRFFNNSGESDYSVNDLGILVNTRDLRMNGVKSGAIWYTPVIKKLEVAILGNRLDIRIEGECDLKAGIWMHFNGNFKAYSILNNQTAEFKIDGIPYFNHHEDIPWYFSFLIPLVGWIAGIVIHCISDDLMNSITKIFRERICIDNISPVSWTNNPKNIKLNNVTFADSFIIEYLLI